MLWKEHILSFDTVALACLYKYYSSKMT